VLGVLPAILDGVKALCIPASSHESKVGEGPTPRGSARKILVGIACGAVVASVAIGMAMRDRAAERSRGPARRASTPAESAPSWVNSTGEKEDAAMDLIAPASHPRRSSEKGSPLLAAGSSHVDSAVIYDNRGLAYLSRGEYDQAIADFTKAIEIDVGFAEALNNRGVAYRHMNIYDKALADFTGALRIDPNYTEALNNRGVVYNDLGHPDKAIADFTRALDAHGVADTTVAYAEGKSSTTHYRGMPLDSSHPDSALAVIYYNTGLAFKSRGDLTEAILNYLKAVSFNESLLEARYGLAVAFEQDGAIGPAIENYKMFLRLSNDADSSSARVETVREHLRRLEEQVSSHGVH
jgi:tetratricopeptide (TPR) repeat protein